MKMHDIWYNYARGNMGQTGVVQCNHGLAAVPDDSHPVSSFITTFCMSSIKDALLRHPEVINDENNREF